MRAVARFGDAVRITGLITAQARSAGPARPGSKEAAHKRGCRGMYPPARGFRGEGPRRPLVLLVLFDGIRGIEEAYSFLLQLSIVILTSLQESHRYSEFSRRFLVDIFLI